MCGIFGFVGKPDKELLGRMDSVLVHRGPDDTGALELPWVSLGHRRLSVIDVACGHQPMANEDDTVHVVFNGEIYNYRELRPELERAGHVFHTNSDTEVLIHAYEEYGVDCFKLFNGMWAAAIADVANKKVILCRDNFGIKPLYYAKTAHRILFGSEIKALLEDPEIKRIPDDQVVYEYLTHGLHEDRRESFLQGVNRVMAAEWVELGLSGETPAVLRREFYWKPEIGTDGSADPKEFLAMFRKAVERRLVAEVPVGACLSGGLDSTAIVCLMHDLMNENSSDAGSLGGRLKTFSAVFGKDPIDESEYIKVAVEASGADPTYIQPTAATFAGELLDVMWHQEEPMVSTGPYAQYCVMREAKKKATVLLDGQGGDELLGGYVPYQFVYLRQLLKEGRYGKALREAWLAKDVMWPLAKRRMGQKKKQLSIRSMLKPAFAGASKEPATGPCQDNLKRRLLQDLTIYSLPALLRYEDRNAAAFSIESRVSYLDQELVEWILRLPEDALIHDGWSRYILREGLRGVIPEKIRKRRWKVGFSTPEMRWLKALRATFTSIYQSPVFQSRPYWQGDRVAQAFRDACEGKIEESMFFWRAANVELWLRVFVDGNGKPHGSVADAGDRIWAGRSDAGEAAALVRKYLPNQGKHLLAAVDDTVYARIPVKTDLVRRGDPLVQVVARAVSGHLKDGDLIAVAEKPVAISQGRSYPIDEIEVGWLASVLSRSVTRTPHGIGLGIPQTMQLAINEVGAPRIIYASVVAAVARLFGVRGVFYKIAGPTVTAIDGPTAGTLPPYNGQAKLGPKDPAGFASELARTLGKVSGAAVIDANDLNVEVMGVSQGVDRHIVEALMRDNPLGQGHEQTPVCILRAVGKLGETGEVGEAGER